VLADFDDAKPSADKVILIGTGSEVQLAVQARERLAAEGISARVVSVPCLEWFEQQDEAYQRSVLPPEVRARVAVEAALPLTWYRWVGDAGEIIGIDHYGASADYKTLYEKFGITTDAVVSAARSSLKKTGN
jgi:transketolase